MSQTPQPDSTPLAEVFCSRCGYNLRGLTAGRCPECGSTIDPDHLITTAIPWGHRINRGRLRAYWQTVRATLASPAQFCEHTDRPVAYRDAQHFRWMTIAHVIGPLLVAALPLYGLARFTLLKNSVLHETLINIWPAGTFLFCLLAFLLAATGLPSYFCHPRRLPIERQNRAIALSYYATAPLALTPLPVMMILAGVLIQDLVATSSFQLLATGLMTAAVFIVVGQLIAWWLLTIAFVRRTTDRAGSWMSGFNVVLPALWLVLFVATFALTAFTCLYLAAFVISLA